MTKLSEQFSTVRAGDVGIIGDPVSHSLSPLIHNAAFKIWKEAFHDSNNGGSVYHKFLVKKGELGEAVSLLRKKNLRGCNVTVPHKIAIGEFVDHWDPLALRLGAINTLSLRDGLLTGYNTDGEGFRRALEWDMKMDLNGKKVVVLGAGGTGRVIGRMLIELKAAEVFIWNRTSAKAEEFVEEASGAGTKLHAIITDDDLRRSVNEADLVINATSVGLHEKEGLPAPYLEFRPGQAAFDVIYHRETAFLKEAKRNGARAFGGEGMFLYQGVLSFQIWMGSPAPLDVMRDVLQKHLTKGT